MKVVVCLGLIGALALAAGSLVDPPEFDVVSGREWAERAARSESRARPSGAVARVQPAAPPAVPSYWVLLAGGLIVSVLGLAMQAGAKGLVPLRARTPAARSRPG